jgi:hypothetical protein
MLNFLPWRFLVKHAARHYGVLDPATFLAKLRGFAQPSEVAEPLELLRAGIIFHARGLVNSKAIQHNLDWVWPYWVERQFNPEDNSFIPRAFSFSHINLTHRNWTAVGLPNLAVYPIVDPRGLVTPLYDGWSLDFWIITDSGRRLLPSKLEEENVAQRLLFEPDLAVETRCGQDGLELHSHTWLDRSLESRTRLRVVSNEEAWLAVAIRPYNPEGVQFIHKISQAASNQEFHVNGEATVRLDAVPDITRMAHYADGDVFLDLSSGSSQREITCGVGMATAAALFRLDADVGREFEIAVTLERDLKDLSKVASYVTPWKDELEPVAKLRVADEKMQFLYDAALRTVLLLSADDLVPGPYTYRRFWFRDACLMLHPLLAIGLKERARRIIERFPGRQTRAGYFLSQEGEWDSNGQVLWILSRYAEMTGNPLGEDLQNAMYKGVEWLDKKRLGAKGPEGTQGLLPAGFSAEHLGPNDYYYWDNYWAWAGLEAAAEFWKKNGPFELSVGTAKLARQYAANIASSIDGIPERRKKGGVPAAPGRRMDAGAIGGMVADYPLQLYPAGDPRMLKTAEYLMSECFSNGGFLQQMIHSGVNAYLTLDLAQTLLRADDPRFADLIRRVAELSSPTGQWPEAIHPRTLGGCMGDGQHGWAAAEWIMMIRNCFVREEKDELVIGSGILPEWWGEHEEMSFGPTLTAWGTVSVAIKGEHLRLDAKWRTPTPRITLRVPGFAMVEAEADQQEFTLQRI